MTSLKFFIPAWETIIDFNQIQYALRSSATSEKVVQIIRGKGKCGIYATPTNNDAIYIGPFDQNYAIEMILLQKFNGRILRREDYENIYAKQKQNIVRSCFGYILQAIS